MPVNVETLLQKIKDQFTDSFPIFKFQGPRFYVDLLLNSRAVTVKKSFTDAKILRSLGDQQYQEGRFDKALKLYTNSLASSPENTPESDLAYANRSTALYAQRKYVSCLLDINRVLANPYNEYYHDNETRERLRKLKERCLLRVRQRFNARTVRIRDDETDPIDIDDGDEEWRNLICKRFNNPFATPSPTSKIRLQCNEQWGRHMVATADIEPGEALSAEEFFLADVLCDDFEQENCSYCLKACSALIPCPSCAVSLYCSKRCRTRAHFAYHRTECLLWSFYIKQKMDVPNRLAVRALIIGTGQGAKLEYLMKTLTIEDIFAEEVDPTARPFHVCNAYLTTLTHCRTFDESQLLLYVDLAVRVINKLADDSSFFVHVSEKSLNSSKLFAAALLVNHIYTLRKNEFLLPYRIHEPRSMTKVVGQHFLHIFLNHSCNANAFSIIRNRMHVLFAQRPIKKDEQIFITYCGSFADVPKSQRLEALKSIWDFTCSCEACSKNWPKYGDLVIESVKCGEYGNNGVGDGRELIRDLKHMTTPIFNGSIQNLSKREILQTMVNVIKIFYHRIKPPSLLIILSEITLKIFVEQLYGDIGEIKIFKLDNIEKLVNEKDDITEIVSILENLFFTISQRFFASRLFYELR